jgi:hypothetical protein
MNSDQVGGLIRAAVASGFAYAAGKGWLPVGDYAGLAAAIAGAIVAAWSVFSNKSGKTIA